MEELLEKLSEADDLTHRELMNDPSRNDLWDVLAAIRIAQHIVQRHMTHRGPVVLVKEPPYPPPT